MKKRKSSSLRLHDYILHTLCMRTCIIIIMHVSVLYLTHFFVYFYTFVLYVVTNFCQFHQFTQDCPQTSNWKLEVFLETSSLFSSFTTYPVFYYNSLIERNELMNNTHAHTKKCLSISKSNSKHLVILFSLITSCFLPLLLTEASTELIKKLTL